MIVVSDVRATGESRQLFIAGPAQFTRTTGEDLEFEQWVYHGKDCTPYDRVIVKMSAYLIPTGSALPGPIAKLVQQGGLVAEGNGERAQVAREQLAKLGADSDVIPLGQYAGAFPDPATDPERQDHEFANSVGRTLRSRIRYQLTNQHEIGGPCNHIAVTAKTTAASPAARPNRPPVLKPILAWYVPDPSQTTYEVDISDPDPADKVTVAWTLAPSSCGMFDQLEVVGSAVAGGTAKAFATWRHASSNGCEHAGAPDDHAGTISVVVSDGHWTCATSFLRGAHPGNGPAPRTCTRIGAAATTVKPG